MDWDQFYCMARLVVGLVGYRISLSYKNCIFHTTSKCQVSLNDMLHKALSVTRPVLYKATLPFLCIIDFDYEISFEFVPSYYIVYEYFVAKYN